MAEIRPLTFDAQLLKRLLARLLTCLRQLPYKERLWWLVLHFIGGFTLFMSLLDADPCLQFFSHGRTVKVVAGGLDQEACFLNPPL